MHFQWIGSAELRPMIAAVVSACGHELLADGDAEGAVRLLQLDHAQGSPQH